MITSPQTLPREMMLSHNDAPVETRILLVDDNPTNLKVLSDALRDQGWTTLVATDGESAIEQVEYAAPSLILLDVMMPGIDGFETCRRLKSDPKTAGLPIIFMTALSDTVDKVKGLELGAVDYITKPFQHEEVLARVRLHLSLFTVSQSLEKKVIEQAKTALELQQLAQSLEERVQARTSEVEQSLNNLKTAQLQLIQSEKMSVLGQLVAGVGHEINNPIGCIDGNIKHAANYIQDLLELINLYQEAYPTPAAKIADHIEEIDLEYLVEDLPKILKSMKSSSSRIQEISLSLRSFSRSDDRVPSDVDVHEGLESTIMILKHRLKANELRPEIQIKMELGQLPKISAYSGPLNQVFMNIVANAIDAIDESYQHPDRDPEQVGTISISSSVDQVTQKILLSIRDNGTGISEETQERIFEQSFTTKPIGQGTGLGLAISQQIIEEKHKGNLLCKSQIGSGTEFQICLPIQ
jgi:signal transduction histidine kinase